MTVAVMVWPTNPVTVPGKEVLPGSVKFSATSPAGTGFQAVFWSLTLTITVLPTAPAPGETLEINGGGEMLTTTDPV